jgi:hypothetical protein
VTSAFFPHGLTTWADSWRTNRERRSTRRMAILSCG